MYVMCEQLGSMLRTLGPNGVLGTPEHYISLSEELPQFCIGRSPDCQLVLDSEQFPLLISRKHAL